MREIMPSGTLNHETVARATHMGTTIQRLQAIYSRPGTKVATSSKSSSGEEVLGSEESDDDQAAELGDEEAASPTVSMDLDSSDSSKADAP
jgi:hypothetical protein